MRLHETGPPLLPFAQCPLGRLARCRGVLTDIDDTLTENGALTPEAQRGLARLRSFGLPTIAVTGRPLGWSEPFARAWPVDAIVAENGAVALFQDGTRLRIEYLQDETTRAANAVRLRQVQDRVLSEVPGALPARDSAGRATDIAIDHAEFTTLAPAQIDRVLAIMRSEGMNATVSSIHINGWFGDHDKPAGARWIVERLYGETANWVYVGDSTNDQAMFERFPLSVGVANLMHFAAQLHVWPAYITRHARGRGFLEVVRRIGASRSLR